MKSRSNQVLMTIPGSNQIKADLILISVKSKTFFFYKLGFYFANDCHRNPDCKRRREAGHTHAPGPCHVHVTVSWRETTNYQPSKCNFHSATKGMSRQTVSAGAGMQERVSAGRAGEPSVVAGSQGSSWQQEFTRQKQL